MCTAFSPTKQNASIGNRAMSASEARLASHCPFFIWLMVMTYIVFFWSLCVFVGGIKCYYNHWLLWANLCQPCAELIIQQRAANRNLFECLKRHGVCQFINKDCYIKITAAGNSVFIYCLYCHTNVMMQLQDIDANEKMTSSFMISGSYYFSLKSGDKGLNWKK